MRKQRVKKMAELRDLIEEIDRLLLPGGDLDLAEERVEEALKVLSSSHSELERSMAYSLAARVKLELGRNYEEAERYALKSFDLLKDTAMHQERGKVQFCLGRIYISLGNLEKARCFFEDSLSTYRLIGDTIGVLDAVNGLSHVNFILSERGEAIKRLEYGLAESKRINDSRRIALFSGNLGVAYLLASRWQEAEERLSSGLKIYESIGDNLQIARRSISLSRLYLRERRWLEASRHIQRAKKISQEHNFPREMAMSLESEGELSYERKEYTKAPKSYLEALKIGEQISPGGDIVSQVSRKLADLYVAIKHPNKAIEYSQRAMEISTRLGDKFEQGCCHRTLAMANGLKGLNDKAQEEFAKAISIFKSIGERFELGLTLLKAGRYFISLSKAAGLKQLREADRLFAEIGPGCEYYIGLAKTEMAKAELFFSHPDEAQNLIAQAEAIFLELDAKEALEETTKLRSQVERLFRAAISPEENSYLLLKELSLKPPSEAGLRSHLKNLLLTLDQRVGADEGFVAYRDTEGLKVAERVKLREEEAEKALSLLVADPLEPGELIVKLSADGKFSSLNVGCLLVMPLGLKGRLDGLLYLAQNRGRIGFKIDDVNFFVAFSERIGKVISDLRAESLEAETLVLKAYEVADRYGFPWLVTDDQRMKEVLRKVEKVNDAPGPVLLSGESGTGKELVAKLIHYSGCRKGEPFVTINCGAIPENLLESELFGHERGAFTGAYIQKKGELELSDGGTVFLDEIGEFSLTLQPKVLRFLEDQTFKRVGGTKEIKVDVRMIAATNKDLQAEVKAGKFRDALFYRLNCFTIELPPLRQRKGDIPLLVEHFIRKSCRESGEKQIKGVTPQAMEMLMGYEWRGNVRELKNLINSAVIFADGDMITPDLVEIGKERASVVPQRGYSLPEKVALMEKEECLRALEKSNWKITKAADMLGIPRGTLQSKMKKLEIRRGLNFQHSNENSALW